LLGKSCILITKIGDLLGKSCLLITKIGDLLGWLIWLVYGVLCHFQQYFSYIVAVSFIGGGNQCMWRKPLTCRK
jgi:hypothetical protein